MGHPQEERHLAVARALRSYTGAVESYLRAQGRGHEMHQTDLTALAMTMDAGEAGPMTPGALGARLGISASAASSLVERLVRSGHLRREPHPHDRRSVTLAVTDLTLEMGREVFGRVALATQEVMDRYRPEELDLIARFLTEATEATLDAARDDPGPRGS
ncbi:MarR family winged helix-turn-helix transcriptional regulator [Nocardioides sp.]|uniref:MarR family winged helix-turn-helix transcriptional regulator n=1 Tax=Nocardioides sp. TaxID=35761 RepID=UPI003512D87E